MPLYQHRFQGACAAGDIYIFSWWSDREGEVAAANAAAVTWATAFWNGPGEGDGYGSLVTEDVTMTNVSTGEIDEATGQQQTLAEAGVSLVGTAVGAAMPADVAIVVSLRTPLANRRGRGRFYLPQPAAATLTTTGRLSSAAQATIVGSLGAAWTTYNAAGTPVVYSRTNRDTVAVTTFNVGDLYDTQRGRESALNEVRLVDDMP